ncbi:tRNA uridine 5-carboxymethylaminomethyl modification enzyme [Acrasis kona]|uniref:tRNA uridine 5-carboxymethylaminomethyl modification enzyme n=1 Tax=Acrasis kona TaxID=1008807 RepID=A0AAW2Z6J3_9EUKA
MDTQDKWIIYRPSHSGEGYKVVSEKAGKKEIQSRPQHDTFDDHKCKYITRDVFTQEIYSQQSFTKQDRKAHLKEYLKTQKENRELAKPVKNKTELTPIEAWPSLGKLDIRIKLTSRSKKDLDPENLDYQFTQPKQKQSLYARTRHYRHEVMEKVIDCRKINTKQEKEVIINASLVTSEQIISRSKVRIKKK